MKKSEIRNPKSEIIICTVVVLFFLSSLSYARTTAEGLADIEKLFMETKYDRVVSEADKLIESGGSGREELNYLKALSLLQLNRFNEARQTFEYMVERYPRGKRAFDGYIGIGDSYFLEGKFNEAVVAYNDALKNFPDHKNSAVVYYKMGSSYQKLGLSDKANEYFNKAKQAAPLSFESKMISKDMSVKETTAEPDTGDYYYVQAGYFKTKANADKLNDKLHQKGYESYIATLVRPNATFYKVKVGHFQARSEAELMAKKLKNSGYLTKVCR